MTKEEKKIEEIYTSYVNGQKRQMVNQIKAYGQAKFFVDFYEWLEIFDWRNPKEMYAAIVYNFFLIK